ncbi:hypothetical protein ACLOJK_012551 [Asimina triloba]
MAAAAGAEQGRKGEEQGPHVVLLPLPLQGHITPMLQLANLLHSKGFSITIIHTHFNAPNPTNYPNFNFEAISQGLSIEEATSMEVIALLEVLNKECKGPLEERMGELAGGKRCGYGPIKCIIHDAMMHFAQSVAPQFEIPRLVLRTSSAISFVSFAAYPFFRQKGLLVPEYDWFEFD